VIRDLFCRTKSDRTTRKQNAIYHNLRLGLCARLFGGGSSAPHQLAHGDVRASDAPFGCLASLDCVWLAARLAAADGLSKTKRVVEETMTTKDSLITDPRLTDLATRAARAIAVAERLDKVSEKEVYRTIIDVAAEAVVLVRGEGDAANSPAR
jgi:hypothetical protein